MKTTEIDEDWNKERKQNKKNKTETMEVKNKEEYLRETEKMKKIYRQKIRINRRRRINI